MDETERRYVELRAAPDGRRLEGVAVRYGDVAALPWGKERFEAGAFADRMSDVRLTVQHDRGRPLARTGAGLTLDDNAERLALAAELPVTREADDTLTPREGWRLAWPEHRISGRRRTHGRRDPRDIARHPWRGFRGRQPGLSAI